MINQQLTIAICIPTYNQCDYLPFAIQSALEQRNVNTEVWVSSDASTDETDCAMKKYNSNPRVFYHRHNRNMGIAANASWVLSQPKAQYLVRLDSDDKLLPDYCSILSCMLARHPRAAVAHCAVWEINEAGQRKRKRLLSRRIGVQSANSAFRGSISGYRVAANICMFRREALLSQPYIYRSGMNFCEDWDLFARLTATGWENVYSPRLLAEYRVWSDSCGIRNARKELEVEGLIRLFDETLEPAWNARGWDISDLNASRRKLAKLHTQALLLMPIKSSPNIKLVSLLQELGRDEMMVNSEASFLRSPLGRLSMGVQLIKMLARDSIKKLFFS